MWMVHELNRKTEELNAKWLRFCKNNAVPLDNGRLNWDALNASGEEFQIFMNETKHCLLALRESVYNDITPEYQAHVEQSRIKKGNEEDLS